MKKTEITGEFADELKLKIESVEANTKTIERLSAVNRSKEKRMWEAIRAEYPESSDNCRLSVDDGKVILIDFLETENE